MLQAQKVQKPPLMKMTPMMEQYWQVKEENPDCLLFFRMGDFYELFFDDAVIAAKELDITLTKRGKDAGDDIPMCGVPIHSHEVYLGRLIKKGHKVAICEQTESPEQAKKRGHKGPLKREIVRVITPGTLTEENLLNARRHNFLVALSPVKADGISLAAIDLSTGDVLIETPAVDELMSVISRLGPSEIVLPDRLLEDIAQLSALKEDTWRRKLTLLPAARFDEKNGMERLKEIYQVKTLEGFGDFNATEIQAAGTLVDYIYLTQKASLQLLRPPKHQQANQVLSIDPATRRSLELDWTLSGRRQGSVLDTIDRTITSAGARLMAMRLASPLTDVRRINDRLNQVQHFTQNGQARHHIRDCLKLTPDMERSVTRVCMERGSPRDLSAIRDALSQAELIRQYFEIDGVEVGPISDLIKKLGHQDVLIDRLTRALTDNPPPHTRDGGFIAEGYHPALDEHRHTRNHARELVSELQEKYRKQTGINSLKIKHNNVLGYHIDVGPSHASKVPTDFIHRQTLASSLRYTTTKLSELEKKINNAAAYALTLELQLFDDLISEITGRAKDLLSVSDALAQLDVASALAELATQENHTRPRVDETLHFDIKRGRHPVVETSLKQEGTVPFVANDCHMEDPAKLLLLTGPNMAGKSTYLRQNALIIILAQMGAFVPAESAHIGVVDRLFSRVGASDDLARGRSTFMVEMVETSAILNQATQRSFVILDEIGRGTATYDGLSIAWAVIETLCQVNKCRGLFATHYHELTQLKETLPMLACFTMRIKEWENEVVFLHEVIPGTANKSYGIHVASLAGLPPMTVRRAAQILANLESKKAANKNDGSMPPPSQEARQMAMALTIPESQVEKELKKMDVDGLTPREALDKLYLLRLLLDR